MKIHKRKSLGISSVRVKVPGTPFLTDPEQSPEQLARFPERHLLGMCSHREGLRGAARCMLASLAGSLPVTWVALAKVRIKARFSSSDSADSTVLGSLRKRVNCGWTSELPSAVMSLSAVLSTLKAGTQLTHTLVDPSAEL